MNLLKSQVQRQQQIEQVSKNVITNGFPSNLNVLEAKLSPQKTPGKEHKKINSSSMVDA